MNTLIEIMKFFRSMNFEYWNVAGRAMLNDWKQSIYFSSIYMNV